MIKHILLNISARLVFVAVGLVVAVWGLLVPKTTHDQMKRHFQSLK